jgi:hypothetical protein
MKPRNLIGFYLIAASAVFAVHAFSQDREPMTEAEKIEWYCAQHPDEGANCTAHARLLLPYISDYAKYEGSDTRGGSAEAASDGCDFSPLPPGCPGAASPAPMVPTPPAAVPGGGGFSGGPGGGAPGALPVDALPGGFTPPSDCNAKLWGINTAVVKAQRCLFSPAHAVSGAHAPVSFPVVGYALAIAFRPHAKADGHFQTCHTPAVATSEYCNIRQSLLDANGVVVSQNGQACETSFSTGGSGNIEWSTPGGTGGGCPLVPGRQYYMRMLLTSKQTDRNGNTNCATTVDTSPHIDE